ncbi:MAG: FHA domain-containing protein [Vulcanimicrobiota bacterium]
MNCPDCGAENLEGAAYCEDCGSKLPVGSAAGASAPPPSATPSAPPAQSVMTAGGTLRCGACGAENPATEAYCEDCGASLGSGAASVPDADGGSTPVQAPVVAPPAAGSKLVLATSGKEFPLSKDVITIGRRSPADGIYPDVDLTDDDPESYISRRHGQVIKSGSEFIFEDVGSANGSFVNNARMAKGVQQTLKDGDQVRLGKTEMIFKA